jgi:hypothetical protein
VSDPLTTVGNLIGSLFGTTFGTPMITGAMALIMIIVLGVALRLSLELFIFLLVPSLFLLTTAHFLPSGIMWGVGMIGAVIIFFVIYRIFRQ